MIGGKIIDTREKDDGWQTWQMVYVGNTYCLLLKGSKIYTETENF